jgi:glycosyltransferase involved in cell wall biosynthesis
VGRLVVVSFRLGVSDGVSVEAAKWIEAFRELGHDVTTVAGDGVADVIMPSLAMHAPTAPAPDELQRALSGADAVVVENLTSLPLNPAASETLCDVLEGRAALFRHHDLPWQRPQWRDAPPPRDASTWRHVTINDLSRDELVERGVDAVTARNTFDCDPPTGRREATRRALSLDGERLALFPSRAIPRKNVEGALTLAASLDAALWLLGPAEDGYDEELDRLIASTPARVLRGLPSGTDIHDAYAAADLVVVPSTWEGFGNPVLESVTHRRPLAVYPYPVLAEIRAFGFQFFDLGDAGGVDQFLTAPDDGLLERNAEIARRHFNVKDLPERLRPLLGALGVN